MHRKLLFVLLTFLAGSITAQNICVNFDDCGSLTPSDREHAFNLFGNGSAGCLADWEVTNGTPSIYSTSLATPYTGTEYALLGIHDNNTTEGVAFKYNFTAGQTYTVSMAIYNYNGTPITIDYYLLDAAIPYSYNTGVGSSAIPAVPAGALKVDSITNFTSSQWQVFSFTISNLPQNYSRLWIRQFCASSNYLFVDSFCVNQVPTEVCEDFDNCGNLTASEREHTFNLYGNGNSGCLENWEVTNGTPSVYNSFLAPYSGNDYALFGIHNSSTTEGAALKHNFQMGHTYQVSMMVANNSQSLPIHIDYVLLDSAISYIYNTGVGSSALPAIPGSAQIAHTVAALTSTQWQNVSFTVSGLSKDFSRLWIRQYGSSSNYLFVDHLCISETATTAIAPVNVSEAAIELFPNPANSEINVRANGFSGIIIYDLQGKAMIESVSKNVSVCMLSAGVYIAEIKAGNTVVRKRWVKM